MYASLAFLMMHTFNHEPGDPVLYLPSGSGLVPAKLTQISVADQSITFTVIPLDERARNELIDRIRQAESSEPN